MKNLYRQKIGKWGEDVASEHLAAHGCTICAKNVRTGEGEIDLVVELDGEFRFVEVKTRTSHRFGYPEESVTPVKYEHMAAAAECYLAGFGDQCRDWHLDVVAVYGKPGAENIEVEWLKDVEAEE